MTSSRHCFIRSLAVSALGLCWIVSGVSQASTRGLVESSGGSNTAVLVGVSHGLPGIDIDIKNVETMATNPSYKYSIEKLEENDAVVANIATALTNASKDADQDGTMFFYFSGHGSVGSIVAQDHSMKVGEIKTAIQRGVKIRPLWNRLILIYDSCHAGSMMDPMKDMSRLLPS